MLPICTSPWMQCVLCSIVFLWIRMMHLLNNRNWWLYTVKGKTGCPSIIVEMELKCWNVQLTKVQFQNHFGSYLVMFIWNCWYSAHCTNCIECPLITMDFTFGAKGHVKRRLIDLKKIGDIIFFLERWIVDCSGSVFGSLA